MRQSCERVNKLVVMTDRSRSSCNYTRLCTRAWYNSRSESTKQKPTSRIGKRRTKNVRIASRPSSVSRLTRIVLRQDDTLRLGHASAMLILERWDLSRILAATPATSPEKAAFISSFTVFSFFFPSLETSFFSFFFDPPDCALLRLMFSRYCPYKQA